MARCRARTAGSLDRRKSLDPPSLGQHRGPSDGRRADDGNRKVVDLSRAGQRWHGTETEGRGSALRTNELPLQLRRPVFALEESRPPPSRRDLAGCATRSPGRTSGPAQQPAPDSSCSDLAQSEMPSTAPSPAWIQCSSLGERTFGTVDFVTVPLEGKGQPSKANHLRPHRLRQSEQ